MAVLEAYFDESERRGGLFCVAGFVFERQAAKKFDRELRQLMRHVWPFRMSELVAGRAERFAALSQRERDALLRAAVALINSRITFGVAVSCKLSEVNRCAPRWIRGFGHPYAVCCHVCLCTIGDWVRDSGKEDRVAYLFESGHAAQAEADDLLKGASSENVGRDYYRYKSHGFVPKKDSSHVQAADLFVWEWAKGWDESYEQRIRPLRRSLLALIARYPDRYKANHLTGLPLRRFMAEINKMGLEQLRESRR